MNEPIDAGTITLRSALLMAVSAVTVGIIWQDVKTDIADHERRLAVVETQITRNGSTVDAICETLQCRQKGIPK